MQRFILGLALSVIFTTQLTAMEEKEGRSSCCGALQKAAYKISSQIGRNDFYYYAYKNYVWHLQHKIACKENIKNVDQYYGYKTYKGRENVLTVYRTPLHEAVRWGQLECVKLLCKAGADKNKKIKVSFNDAIVKKFNMRSSITFAECATDDTQKALHSESLHDYSADISAEQIVKRDNFWGKEAVNECEESDINGALQASYVDCSAVDLAENFAHMGKMDIVYFYTSPEDRQVVLDYLKKHE